MKIKILLVCALSCAALFPAAYYCRKHIKKVEFRRVLADDKKIQWEQIRQLIQGRADGFKGVAGIVFEDLKTRRKVLYNGDKLFPSASVVKIPIMGACFKAVREGRIRLDNAVKLKYSDKTPGSGKLKYRPVGSAVTVGTLMQLMVCESDNTAANILINMLGFEYLNNSFKEFGLKNTNISRKMMDFRCRSRGIDNYTTPEDMAVILEKMYNEKFLDEKTSEQCIALLKLQKIKDRIPARLPYDTVVAHKTGLEKNVCHDVGIVFTEKGDFLICMLTKGIPHSRASKHFISETVRELFNFYCANL